MQEEQELMDFLELCVGKSNAWLFDYNQIYHAVFLKQAIISPLSLSISLFRVSGSFFVRDVVLVDCFQYVICK